MAELTSAKPSDRLTVFSLVWEEIRAAPHGGFASQTTFFHHPSSPQDTHIIACIKSAIYRVAYWWVLISTCILFPNSCYRRAQIGDRERLCPVRTTTSRLWRLDIANMGKVEELDYSIKPENVTPQIPTSEWPLLLKNYDKRKQY